MSERGLRSPAAMPPSLQQYNKEQHYYYSSCHSISPWSIRQSVIISDIHTLWTYLRTDKECMCRSCAWEKNVIFFLSRLLEYLLWRWTLRAAASATTRRLSISLRTQNSNESADILTWSADQGLCLHNQLMNCFVCAISWCWSWLSDCSTNKIFRMDS